MSEIITWTLDYASRNKFIFGGCIKIEYSIKKLWDLLTSPQHLIKVHPLCTSHQTEEWIGIGSKDIVIYKNGGQRNRTVIDWDTEKLLRLTVEEDFNHQESIVSYHLKKVNDTCELCIQVETEAYKNIPRPIWKLYAKLFLLPQHKKYFGGLLSGFANYKEN